jgi:hypothetical protein
VNERKSRVCVIVRRRTKIRSLRNYNALSQRHGYRVIDFRIISNASP